jgi:hypothetical protein
MCDLAQVNLVSDAQTQAILDRFCEAGCHVATIKLEVKSLDALKLACARLGLEFLEGQRTYRWYGEYVAGTPLPEGFNQDDLGKCTHAIGVPGAEYEIGVQRWKDGTYKLLYDSWSSGGLTQVLGADLNKLRQSYGVSAALLEAQRQGYSAWEEVLEGGVVKIHVQVGT